MRNLFAITIIFSLSVGCVVEDEISDEEIASIEQESRLKDWLKNRRNPGYVALGASITFGIGGTDNIGHTPGFAEYLETVVFQKKTDFLNLSVPGATSGEVLDDQLRAASIFALRHRRDGLVVSVAGGGNDLLQFLNSPDFAICFAPDPTACFLTIGGILAEVDANLDKIVRRLRFFGGRKATIIVRTQYNSFRRTGCDATGGTIVGLGDAALEGFPGTPLENGLNDVIRDVASRYNAEVAEVFLPFASNPDAFVTGDCVHPTDAGYDVLLGIFTSLI